MRVTGECCSHDDQVTTKYENKAKGLSMGLREFAHG